MQRKNSFGKDILLALIVGVVGYMILISTERTGLVDMTIEGILFLCGSIVAFRGYSKSGETINKNFKKFEFFYGLTYFSVFISLMMGVYYYIQNPSIIEIGIDDLEGNTWLTIMNSIKMLSMLFLIITWSNFYNYLNIKSSKSKNTVIYLVGLFIYLGLSAIIWQLVDDVSVLTLGVIVGLVIGIFALIAQDRRARYLTMVFAAYSIIHLIEFYIMGIGNSLTTGILNPIYWGVTVLYVLEVNRWINRELNKN